MITVRYEGTEDMRVSVVYCWTILTGSPADPPHAMGVCRDRDKAMAAAEEYLLRGEGFLATVEVVRPSISTLTLDPCYQRTGTRWIGRRSRNGIYWSNTPQGPPPAAKPPSQEVNERVAMARPRELSAWNS